MIEHPNYAQLKAVCISGLLDGNPANTALPPMSIAGYNRVLQECGIYFSADHSNGLLKLDYSTAYEKFLIAEYTLSLATEYLKENITGGDDFRQLSPPFIIESYLRSLDLPDLYWLASNHILAALGLYFLYPFLAVHTASKGNKPLGFTNNDMSEIICAQASLSSALECVALVNRATFITQQIELEKSGQRKVIDYQLAESSLKQRQRDGQKKGKKDQQMRDARSFIAGITVIKRIIELDEEKLLMTSQVAEIALSQLENHSEHYELDWHLDGKKPKDVRWLKEKIIRKLPEGGYLRSKKGKDTMKSNTLYHELLKINRPI